MARSTYLRSITAWTGVWGALWVLPSLLFSTHEPAFELAGALAAPSWVHPFGQDGFGRDLLRLGLSASGVSFLFAITCVVLSISISMSVITLFMNLQGKNLIVLNRFIDFLLAFPSLLVSLAVVAYLRPGPSSLVLALVIGTFPSLTRLLSGRTRELLSEPFVEAAISLGANRFHLMRRHLLPHFWPIIWVKAPGMVAGALIAEASLTFLGVGLPKQNESWGSLLLAAKDYMIEAPHLMVFSGFPLVISIALLLAWGEALTRKVNHR
jgi:peptide/nickel transport system permease protein